MIMMIIMMALKGANRYFFTISTTCCTFLVNKVTVFFL